MNQTAFFVEPQAQEENQVQTIRGRVYRIRFRNDSNGYSIILVQNPNSWNEPPITCVGYMASIRPDDEYEFTGTWGSHPQFGPQFQFTEAKIILPEDNEGAIRYLASVAHGVGYVTAKKIIGAIDAPNPLQTILENPERLYGLTFLKPGQADEIMENLLENTAMAELSALICRDGIGPGTVSRIYAKYGSEAVQKIKDNPYVISEDVFGIGFKKADAVARALGVAPDSPFRIEAAYEYMLQEATNEGHVYLRPNDTIPILNDLLGRGVVEIKQIAQACKALQDRHKVVRDQDADGKSAIYCTDLFDAEKEVAGDIRRLLATDRMLLPAFPWALDEAIEEQEKEMSIEYATQQKEAVKTALTSPLSVITGGPGTGKSTVTKAICNLYNKAHPHKPIFLASPTGKAAKRLEEATGREAQTIHRLLSFHPEEGFRYNRMSPLPSPGLLIIDEVSMMDIELASAVFQAIDNGMTVVLVGDVDQLPSVGPGCVLRDIIDSGKVPTVRLQFNYRQAGGSKIAEYAHWIVSGRVPPIVQQDGDYECRGCDSPETAQDWLRRTVEEALEQGLTAMDFQVLAPMKRGPVGVDALNELVRGLVNPLEDGKPELHYGRDTVYRLGDKVMVIKNDYKLGVYNGDMGTVKEVKESSIIVDVDGWEIVFGRKDLDKLQHAYAITIHKSQGSEFKLGIICCMTNHYIMLQRNLIYTAITRAKQRLVLLTSERAMKQAVKNDKQAERLSLLKMRIREE